VPSVDLDLDGGLPTPPPPPPPPAAEERSDGGGLWQAVFGVDGSFSSHGLPEPMKVPDYVVEEFRTCALEEAAVAKEGLQELATAWLGEQERVEEDAQGAPPLDLNIKFSYAWTLTKCPSRTERMTGVSLLKQLLDKDGYGYPDECAYALALTHYIHGDLPAARRWCEVLLRMAPDHPKGARLHALVRAAAAEKDRRQMEAVGVAGAVLAGAVGFGIALAAAGNNRR
jgi:hypothetical protein